MEAQLRLMDLDQIDINEKNPRKRIDDESLRDLAASIASVGVIQPIVVTPRDGANLLVTGERRVRAARMAGLKEIPAVVRDLTDKQVLEAMLVENLQRQDLAPLEEADALDRLIREYGWKQQTLGKRIGRSQGWISKRLQLLELPEKAREALYSGGITIEDGLELCKLRQYPEKIIDILEKVNRWGYESIKSRVSRLLQEAEEERIREGKFAKLEAEGKRIWRGEVETWFYPGRKGEALRLDAKQERAHKREKKECLAYGLTPWNDEIVPVCTDPKHWKDELHKTETERHNTEGERMRAEERTRREANEAMLCSITGSSEEVEAFIREMALSRARSQRVAMDAARAFDWKDGRRLDTARLAKEIRKARRRELARLWLVTEALHEMVYYHGGTVQLVMKRLAKKGNQGGSCEEGKEPV
jgi:ParB family chromosome partitioning protein